jgi:hypothetical protein
MAIKFLSGLNLSNVSVGSLLKLDSNGNIVAAVAGTDYSTGAGTWSTAGSNPTTAYYSGNVRVGTYQSSIEAGAKLHVFDYQTTTPKLLIEDGNTGDASMQFKISTQQYTMGIDNSDSDKFVLAASSALGTTNVLEIATNGTSAFQSDLLVNGTIYADDADISGRLDVASDLRIRGNAASIDQGVVRFYTDSSNHFYIDTANNGTQVTKFGADGSLTIESSATQGLTIKQSSSLGADMQVEIRGSRNAPSEGVSPAKLILSSYDSDDGSGVVKTGAEFYMESTSLTGGDLSDFEVGLRYRKDGSVVDGLSIHDGYITAHGSLITKGNIDTRVGNAEFDTTQLLFNAYNGAATNDSNHIGTGIVWRPNYTGYTKRSAGIMQIGEGNYFKSGLAFYTNNTSNNSTDWSERMRLDMDGNLGIGTTSPSNKLHVVGDIYTSTKIKTNSILSTNAGLTIDNTGIQPEQGTVENVFTAKWSGTTVAGIDNEGYVTATGFKKSGTTGFLKSDGSVDTATYISNIPSEYVTDTELATTLSAYVENTDVSFVLNGTDILIGDEIALGGGLSYNSTTGTLSSSDNNTTYTAGTGLTLTGTEFSVTSGTYAAASHNHDSRYYTETEVDTLLQGKASTEVATQSKNGLMSSTDKTKLDGIASGAEVNVQSDWNAASGDALILNKPTLGTAASSAATDFVAVSGDTMSGDLDMNGNDIWNIRTLTLSNLEKTNIAYAYQLLADANDSDAPASLGTYTGSYPEGLYFRDNSNTHTYTLYHTGHFSGTHIANWQTAYGWGNHAGLYAAASHNHDSRYYTETEVDTLLSGKASTDTATSSKNGLMSSTDKSKLDGIASGAEVNVQSDWNATTGDALILNKPTLGTAAAAASTDFVAVAGDTITGQIIFPTAIGNRPVFGDGIIARSDNSDTTGTHDIWGISERYYPSAAETEDQWGIQWSGTPNEINFIGAGSKKLSIDLDTAGTVKIDGNDVATESYVNQAISNLVNSAPAALNTLDELAAALGDDASFSTTVSTALGNRLRVDAAVVYTSGEQATGRSNLGLGSAATSATGDFAAASHTHSQYLRSDASDVYDGRTLSFGTTGNGSNANGAFLSIEGNTDSSGEGSGRIFFREHNSTTALMDSYGVSFGYRGGSTSTTTPGGNSWTGLASVSNGQWGMWGHDNNLTGSLIMYGDRAATFVDFAGNNVQGITDLYVDDQIISTGDTNTYIQFHAADQWRVVTGGTERLEVNNTAVTVAGDLSVGNDVTIAGDLRAASKSFDIPHPTKEGKRLVYGSLEGAEHGVYVRGRQSENVIELPDHWTGLVHEDTITVQITPIGRACAWVEKVEENKVYVGIDHGHEFFYFIQAERKDINKLVVEQDA